MARDGGEARLEEADRRVALVVVPDGDEGALLRRLALRRRERALVLGDDADALTCGGGARLLSENCAGIAPNCAGIAPSCARTDEGLAQRLLRLHAVRLRLVDHVAAEDARAAHRREREAALRPPLVGDHDGVARDDFDDARSTTSASTRSSARDTLSTTFIEVVVDMCVCVSKEYSLMSDFLNDILFFSSFFLGFRV